MPEKPHENSSQWRLTALNFFLFFFLFWCLSVSHVALTVSLFSHYFCASWPVHRWYVLIPVKSRDLLFVAARRQLPSPQHAPRHQQLSVTQSHGSSLHTCVSLGNVCIFPQLHFGRLATTKLRPVLLSFTFLCYPRATLFEEFLVFA